jgi:hypothetical protein
MISSGDRRCWFSGLCEYVEYPFIFSFFVRHIIISSSLYRFRCSASTLQYSCNMCVLITGVNIVLISILLLVILLDDSYSVPIFGYFDSVLMFLYMSILTFWTIVIYHGRWEYWSYYSTAEDGLFHAAKYWQWFLLVYYFLVHKINLVNVHYLYVRHQIFNLFVIVYRWHSDGGFGWFVIITFHCAFTTEIFWTPQISVAILGISSMKWSFTWVTYWIIFVVHLGSTMKLFFYICS